MARSRHPSIILSAVKEVVTDGENTENGKEVDTDGTNLFGHLQSGHEVTSQVDAFLQKLAADGNRAVLSLANFILLVSPYGE